MSILSLAVALLGSYLLGAVPFGYLVARARGVDILAHGSGNIGATNVGRVLGRRWGVLVFALDFAKGALPTLAAALAAPAVPELAPGALAVTAGLAAFLGHLFPVYLGFRGGKGVATGVGVVAVLMPTLAAAALVAWVALLAATRFVSVASLGAAALLLALRLALTPHPFGHGQLAVTLFCFLGTVLVWARHAANLRRLLQGRENRFEETPAMHLLGKTLHVLAVGCWFGAVVFFTITGLVLFDAFEKESLREPRAIWFPLAPAFDQPRPSDKFPEPLKKEQGSRAAGAAVSPLFEWYYGLQTACGCLALITAIGWLSRAGRVHRARVAIVTVALALVVVGWWMDYVVSGLRAPRNELTDRVLTKEYEKGKELTAAEAEQARARAIAEAEEARATFGRWHGYSLLMNMLTLLLVTVAMAMAAALPEGSAQRPAVSASRSMAENGPVAGVDPAAMHAPS